MKKNFKGLLVILLCMFPIFISAATFKPTISCPSSANPGDTISCKITATIDSSIVGVEGKFNLGGTTFVSFVKTTNLNYYVGDEAGFSIGETDGIQKKINSTNLTIGTLKVKIPSNNLTSFAIQVTDLAATDTNYSTISPSPDHISQVVKIKSSDSTLKSLSVEGMTLGPNFKSTITDYALPETDASSIKINAVANNSGAKVTGAGTVSLKYGDNTLNVVVTSEAGTKTTYKIRVHRTDIRDTVNTLSSLGIKNYNISPSFNTSTKTYSLTVEESVTKVEITASLTSSKSSFVKGYGARTVSLKPGKNEVLVKVKAENEKVNTYTINITKSDSRSTNNNLSSLTLSDGNISFNKNTTTYTVNVSSNLKEITIAAIAESDKAKVVGSGTHALVDGSNRIEIKVTAENQAVKTYVLIVNRGTSEENQTIEKKEYIESLIIRNSDINFDPEVYSYDVKLKENETSLDILYKVSDGYSAQLVGNEELKDGSVVKIIVGTGEGTVEYIFNIKKESEEPVSSTNNMIFYVAAGFLGLVVFGILLSILTKRKPTPEEVVKEKFVQEKPNRFYNDPALVDGVNRSQVTGSIISQIERPNSMSDTHYDTQPEPVFIPEQPATETMTFEEPAPYEQPEPIEISNDMEPMPISGPITTEEAGDFVIDESISFDESVSKTEPESFEFTEITEPKEAFPEKSEQVAAFPDMPEFEELSEEDYK